MNLLRFVILSILYVKVTSEPCNGTFPDGFKWGIATSAYQVEGAWNESGKSRHIWDKYTHDGLAYNHDRGDKAGDSYHHLEEDVQLVKKLHVNYYRFSISWTRIIPHPTKQSKGVNNAGIDYYNRLINELIKNDIEPFVTIYHWDLPLSLQEELGGWNSSDVIDHYVRYADVLFNNFGDRVKHWLTFNEPWVICWMGYGSAEYAPSVKEPIFTPYRCGHNILKAHAETYHLYKRKYFKTQQGKVGITLNTDNMHPKEEKNASHKAAAERAQQFNLGWFANPIFGTGDYPEVMKEYIMKKSRKLKLLPRLPTFNDEEKQKLKGSADFLGLNQYTTSLVEPYTTDVIGYPGDVDVKLSHDPKWKTSGSTWLFVTPWGFREVLNWIKREYNNVRVYITENGITDNNGTLNDVFRVRYYREYIHNLLRAVRDDGCNVQGYIAWCLLDTFEWSSGNHEKFGLYQVDFSDPNRKRTAKKSAGYYSRIVRDNGFKNDEELCTREKEVSTPGNSGSYMDMNYFIVLTFLIWTIKTFS
ncbi:hypothetical protein FSP39_020649 [Pinctada imbricata]|uniref:Uncharacterized protein n=1 Tax=Pinctada imbricata TaxID=66713 RepID=A0AA88XTN3_PINIB|nr:hypothetical protein FSP39_020649 [Pinctada imbricata]